MSDSTESDQSGAYATVAVTSPLGTWTGFELMRSLEGREESDPNRWMDPDRLAAELPAELVRALRAGADAPHDRLVERLKGWLPSDAVCWYLPRTAGVAEARLAAACLLGGLLVEGIWVTERSASRLLTAHGAVQLSPARLVQPRAPRVEQVEGFEDQITELTGRLAWVAVSAPEGADSPSSGEAADVPDARDGQSLTLATPHSGERGTPDAVVARFERAVEEAGLEKSAIYEPLHASGATSFDAMVLAEVCSEVLGRKVTMRELVAARRIIDVAADATPFPPVATPRLSPDQEIFAALEAIEPGTEKYRAVYSFDLPASVDRRRLRAALEAVHDARGVLHRALRMDEQGTWSVAGSVPFEQVLHSRPADLEEEIVAAARAAREEIDFHDGAVPYRIVECDRSDGSTALVLIAHHIAFDEISLASYLREVGESYDDHTRLPERIEAYADESSAGDARAVGSDATILELTQVIKRVAPPAAWNAFRFEEQPEEGSVGSWTQERTVDANELAAAARRQECLPMDLLATAFLYALSAFHEYESPVIGMPLNLRTAPELRGGCAGPQVAIAPVWGLTSSRLPGVEGPAAVAEARRALVAYRAVLRQFLAGVGSEVTRSPSGALFTAFMADVNEPVLMRLDGLSVTAKSLLPIPPKFPCTLFVDRTNPHVWRLQLEVDRSVLGPTTVQVVRTRLDEYLAHVGLVLDDPWRGRPRTSMPCTNSAFSGRADDSTIVAGDDHLVVEDLLRCASDVLGRELDAHAGFVQQGGDSLTAVRVANALRKQGYQLKPIELLRRRPMREVELTVLTAAAPIPAVTGARGGGSLFMASHMQEALIHESLDHPGHYRFTYTASIADSVDIPTLTKAVEATVDEMPQLTAEIAYADRVLNLRARGNWRRHDSRIWVESPHFRIEHRPSESSPRGLLVFEFDHFIMDGASAAIVFARIAEWYDALLAGGAASQRDFDPTAIIELQRGADDLKREAGRLRGSMPPAERPIHTTTATRALSIRPRDLDALERARSLMGITASALGAFLAAQLAAGISGREKVTIGLISDGRNVPVENAEWAVGCIMQSSTLQVDTRFDGVGDVQEAMHAAQTAIGAETSMAASDIILSFNQHGSLGDGAFPFTRVDTSGTMPVGASMSIVWELGRGELAYDPEFAHAQDPAAAWEEALSHLTRLLLKGKTDMTAVRPGDHGTAEVEHLVRRHWADVLGGHDEGDFLSAGGDSIAAVRLCIALRGSGFTIRPRDIFANPSVSALSHFLAKNPTDEGAHA